MQGGATHKLKPSPSDSDPFRYPDIWTSFWTYVFRPISHLHLLSSLHKSLTLLHLFLNWGISLSVIIAPSWQFDITLILTIAGSPSGWSFPDSALIPSLVYCSSVGDDWWSSACCHFVITVLTLLKGLVLLSSTWWPLFTSSWFIGTSFPLIIIQLGLLNSNTIPSFFRNGTPSITS